MTRPPQPALEAAMRRALELAASPGVPTGPNPRVGCVLLAPDGTTVAEGHHRGAGSPHAEAAALAAAGAAAAGTTAVVTLEPCAHTGRTGPCAQALIRAGVVGVVFAQRDPNPVAAGGEALLRAAGLEVETGLLAEDAAALNETWTFAVSVGRPFVTWKAAATLDGRIAAADGSSRWITSSAARADVHALRGEVDAVVVGTGTVLADDPHLAVRRGGQVAPGSQPMRVVVGLRDIPAGSRVLDDAARTLQLRTHDPREVLATLFAHDVQHVLLEGGPTLAAAFVRADLVDAVRWYAAPALLGAGRAALDDAGMESIAQALRLDVVDVVRVGDDVRIDARVRRERSR
ncbi:MAG TPA: bifunctional diaminohydroxyphosphoribosylaminopyrimidine deaminase/5-amino-6-(5-phosphoribosylamino)uracil reductase RibD [Candidatus Nanopelagicales bacterium]|nr:bifunctional diaminohydroxyphosphoribosylaminopyrimidine deaminase/5-amino-6-(5-phosphoribosylamino)uracil reductase RibD [Candidatus Nanopelagicales bacterium]